MKIILLLLLLQTSLIATAQIPKLNSLATAEATVFLDFDGHTVESSVWNNGFPFVCDNPNLSSLLITETFNLVAEDYKIFNVNITTDSAKFLAAPLTQRVRVIITPTNFFAPGNAGVAYMGSLTWGDNTPAFVFANNTSPSKYIGEAISHEAGHTLGLDHQAVYDTYCNLLDSYNHGQGTGEIGWAPIMGYPLDKSFTTWHNGKRSISCNQQNDIQVVASKIQLIGLLPDDVENTITNAPNIGMVGININATGVINSATDVDVFKLPIVAQSKFVLQAVPPSNSTNESIGDVDLLVKLLNSAGTVLRTYNYSDSLNARIDTILSAGTYYLSIDGTNNVNTPNDYGSTGNYILKGTLQTTLSLPIYKLDIRGSINNNQHVINWQIQADEPIAKSELEYSTDGTTFNTLQQIDIRANSYSYKPFTSNIIYYRLKAYLRNGSYKTSNIMSLQGIKLNNKINVLSNTVTDKLLVTVQENMQYEIVDAKGSTINKGTLTTVSINQIDIAKVASGIYFLKVANGKEVFAQRLVKN